MHGEGTAPSAPFSNSLQWCVCAGAAVGQGALPAWGSHAPGSQTGAGAVCWDTSFIGGAGLSGTQVLLGMQVLLVQVSGS